MADHEIRLIVACSILAVAFPAAAEVAVEPVGTSVSTLVMGITDDPNPIGAMWQPFRPIAQDRMLNPGGHLRGDGPPDVSAKPSGSPVVTWAYNAGSDHDIAIAEWTGAAWSAIEFLTSGNGDDLDPRIFVEPDGTMHAVWWTDDGVDKVLLATKPAAAAVWDAPVEVALAGRRPSIAVFNGVLRIAYERDFFVGGMAQDIVILRRETSSSFAEEFVASTDRTERLDIMLHVTGTKLWLDWKHGGQVFGYASYGASGWSGVEQPSWPEPSWVGVEETRKVIQQDVLAD